MDQNKWHPTLVRLGGVLAALLIVFVAVKIVGSVKALPHIGDNPNVPETISVYGKGEVFTKPDIATFSFTVSEESAVVSTAQEKATAKTNSVLEYLAQSGVEEKDIKTVAYDIYPRYDYKGATYYVPGRQVLAAYVVSQTIEVKVRKIEDAGKLLTGIGEFGVSNVSGLTFLVDDQDNLARQARDKAIADAREQAERLAEALGVELGSITSFYENAPYQPFPVYYGKEAALGMGGDGQASNQAQIPGGESKITSNVTITYQIR